MRLIIGGCAQGKLDYAREKWPDLPVTDGAQCSPEAAESALLIDHFHLLVKRIVESGGDAAGFSARLARVNPQAVVISDEVGMGVVPVDAFEREWREQVGRSLCVLARASESVERIVCGIGVKIK